VVFRANVDVANVMIHVDISTATLYHVYHVYHPTFDTDLSPVYIRSIEMIERETKCSLLTIYSW
jgi:hypothetical protein